MAVVKLKIYVAEITNVMLSFDKVQVHRSAAGSPYTDAIPITADSAQYPTLLGANEGPYSGLQGTTLRIKVDGGVEQVVTFTANNPIGIPTVVDEFNAVVTGAVMVADAGKPRITGDNSGTDGILELVGGGSLSILGFTAGDKDNGEDPHISLQAGVNDYAYDDKSGEASYWYLTRYYSQSSKTFSSWSEWTQGTVGAVISPSNLIVGKIRLAEVDGTAVIGAEVKVVNVFNPLVKDDFLLAGRPKKLITDGSGLAETPLIKGSTVDVVVVGTSIVRRILVPDTGTEFDMLDPSLWVDDPFAIQVPDLPAAVRRT